MRLLTASPIRPLRSEVEVAMVQLALRVLSSSPSLLRSRERVGAVSAGKTRPLSRVPHAKFRPSSPVGLSTMRVRARDDFASHTDHLDPLTTIKLESDRARRQVSLRLHE